MTIEYKVKGTVRVEATDADAATEAAFAEIVFIPTGDLLDWDIGTPREVEDDE